MATTDISRYRKTPRPLYSNASTGTQVQISLDFETFLLTLSGIQKRTLISRLQKSLTISRTKGARDNLYKIALENQAANAGAEVTELDADLGEFQIFMQDELASAHGVTEVGMLISDIGTSYGENLFARDQANNSLIAANVFYSQFGNSPQKKQIQSWIEIITQYIIPG